MTSVHSAAHCIAICVALLCLEVSVCVHCCVKARYAKLGLHLKLLCNHHFSTSR